MCLWDTVQKLACFIAVLWVALLGCWWACGYVSGSVFVWQCVPEMAASSVACLCWHLDVKSCTSHAVLAYDRCGSMGLSKGIYLYPFCCVSWLNHFTSRCLPRYSVNWQAWNNWQINLFHEDEVGELCVCAWTERDESDLQINFLIKLFLIFRIGLWYYANSFHVLLQCAPQELRWLLNNLVHGKYSLRYSLSFFSVGGLRVKLRADRFLDRESRYRSIHETTYGLV